jgi:hypothetical protein
MRKACTLLVIVFPEIVTPDTTVLLPMDPLKAITTREAMM